MLPNHTIHCNLDKLLLGKTFPKIHAIMDTPCFFGLPRLLHEPVIACFVGYHLYGEDGIYGALLHVEIDRLFKKAIGLRDVEIDFTIHIDN